MKRALREIDALMTENKQVPAVWNQLLVLRSRIERISKEQRALYETDQVVDRVAAALVLEWDQQGTGAKEYWRKMAKRAIAAMKEMEE